jgi:hypothetical protein
VKYRDCFMRGLSSQQDQRALFEVFVESLLADLGRDLSLMLPNDVVFQWRKGTLHVYCPRSGDLQDFARLTLIDSRAGDGKWEPELCLRLTLDPTDERQWLVGVGDSVEGYRLESRAFVAEISLGASLGQAHDSWEDEAVERLRGVAAAGSQGESPGGSPPDKPVVKETKMKTCGACEKFRAHGLVTGCAVLVPAWAWRRVDAVDADRTNPRACEADDVQAEDCLCFSRREVEDPGCAACGASAKEVERLRSGLVEIAGMGGDPFSRQSVRAREIVIACDD